MATGAQTWSTTAASNNSADSSVNWAEGMAPSAVNNSARAEMASAAMWIGDNSGVLLTSGTTAAFTVTSKQVQTAVTDGYTIAVRLHGATEAGATLNVDGVGGKAIQTVAGTNVAAGELPAGSIQRFTYHTSSTAWVVHGQRSSGAVAFTSISVSSSATISGGLTASSTLHVAGAASIGGALAVTGGVTASSTLHVAGAVSVGGAATVTGAISGATVTGAMVAAQSDQETGTATSLIVTPGRQHYHPASPKAWGYVTFSGGTPSLTASYNVTSLTDNGTGQTQINLTNAFSSANYAVVTSLHNNFGSISSITVTTGQTASAFQINTYTAQSANNTGVQSVDYNFSFACYGDM